MNEEDKLKELFYAGEYELVFTLIDGMDINYVELDFNRILYNNKNKYYKFEDIPIKGTNYRLDIYSSDEDKEIVSTPNYLMDKPNYTHLEIRFTKGDGYDEHIWITKSELYNVYNIDLIIESLLVESYALVNTSFKTISQIIFNCYERD